MSFRFALLEGEKKAHPKMSFINVLISFYKYP